MTAYSLVAALQSVSMPDGPSQIIVQSHPDQLQRVGYLITFMLGLASSLLMLYLTNRRRDLERKQDRKAEWYRKVVVDPSLARLDAILRTAESFTTAATECRENYRSTKNVDVAQMTIDREISRLTAEITAAKLFISTKFSTLDANRTVKVLYAFDRLIESVTAWFLDYVFHRAKLEDLRTHLSNIQYSVFILLQEYELHSK